MGYIYIYFFLFLKFLCKLLFLFFSSCVSFFFIFLFLCSELDDGESWKYAGIGREGVGDGEVLSCICKGERVEVCFSCVNVYTCVFVCMLELVCTHTHTHTHMHR